MAAQNLPHDGPPLNRPQSAKDRYWLATLATRCAYLTPMDKLLFTRMLDLDRPTSARVGGCFASPAALAEDLGVTVRTIETTRARLRRLGLVVRQEDAKRNPRWFPLVPPHVLVMPPTDLKGNGMDVWLRKQTERFNNAVCIGAHRERTLRRSSRSQAASTDAGTPKNEVSSTEKVGAVDRKERGSRPKKVGAPTEKSGGDSGPRAALNKRGLKAMRERASGLVGDVVNHAVSDGVSHGVADPLTDVRGALPDGRPAVLKAGFAGGAIPAPDEPNEFSGWFSYRDTAIAMLGGLPSSDFDEAREKAGYLRARRGGASHESLMRLARMGMLAAQLEQEGVA